MMALVRGPLRGLFVLILLVGMAFPVFAQAQTPSQPGPTPELDISRPSRSTETSDTAKPSDSSFSNRQSTRSTGRSGVTRSRKTGSGVVEVIGDTEGEIRVTSPEGAFEPVKSKAIAYPEVPDVGQAMTLTGPMSVDQFVEALSLATNWNVLTTEAVQPIVLKFWITGVKPRAALEILKFHNIYYEFDAANNFLYLMTTDEYRQREFGELAERTFRIRHASIADIETVLSSLRSSQGSLIANPRTNDIIVRDTADNLAAMEEAVRRFDVPIEADTISLTHIDVATVTASAEALLSERGMIVADNRFNTITVQDLPEERKRIRELLETLDQSLETRTWTLNYADPDEMADQVIDLIPEGMGSVIVNAPVHKLTVTALPVRLEEIDRLITAWDVRRRQVKIDVYLVKANSSVIQEMGVKWNYENTSEDVINGPYTADVDNLLLDASNFAITAQDVTNWRTVQAQLEFLMSDGKTTILSQPSVTVQDGEEALFKNTEEIPYVSSVTIRPYFYTDEDGDRVREDRETREIQRLSVGIILKVLPRIAEAGTVLLDISAEESAFIKFEALGTEDQPQNVPRTTENKAETQVRVGDGQTIVIGGLGNSSFDDQIDKVPVLGDVPLMKHLFRKTSKDAESRELLIFITTTIVGEDTHPEAEFIADVDEFLDGKLNKFDKDIWGQMGDYVSRDSRDVYVGIGQSGDLHTGGEEVSLERLREVLGDAATGAASKVVLRVHPRAPQAVVDSVTEMALELKLGVEFDDKPRTFVPDYRR